MQVLSHKNHNKCFMLMFLNICVMYLRQSTMRLQPPSPPPSLLPTTPTPASHPPTPASHPPTPASHPPTPASHPPPLLPTPASHPSPPPSFPPLPPPTPPSHPSTHPSFPPPLLPTHHPPLLPTHPSLPSRHFSMYVVFFITFKLWWKFKCIYV